MPAFYSHFTFGIEGYRGITDSDFKKLVKDRHCVYTVGLLGPDLFFYFLPDVLLGRKKPAIVMHEYKTNQFFENLLTEAGKLTGQEQEIAFVYIAGFIGHYAMDCACHPYIYKMAARHEQQGNWHYMYESAMDIFCCRHFLHRYPAQIHQHRLLHLSRQEMRTVCRLAAKAYNKTYHLPYLTPLTIKGAIGCMHVTIAFLNDKKGHKESFVEQLEKKLLGHGLLSPLFVNFNTYQMDKQEMKYFLEMFSKGQERFGLYLQGLTAYWRSVCAEQTVKILKQELLHNMGNLSYHTGNPCEAAYHLKR